MTLVTLFHGFTRKFTAAKTENNQTRLNGHACMFSQQLERFRAFLVFSHYKANPRSIQVLGRPYTKIRLNFCAI